jgi:hypothetical protein
VTVLRKRLEASADVLHSTFFSLKTRCQCATLCISSLVCSPGPHAQRCSQAGRGCHDQHKPDAQQGVLDWVSPTVTPGDWASEKTKKTNKTVTSALATKQKAIQHANEMGRLAFLSLCCLFVALISLAQAVDLRGVHPSGRSSQKSREWWGATPSANVLPS